MSICKGNARRPVASSSLASSPSGDHIMQTERHISAGVGKGQGNRAAQAASGTGY